VTARRADPSDREQADPRSSRIPFRSSRGSHADERRPGADDAVVGLPGSARELRRLAAAEPASVVGRAAGTAGGNRPDGSLVR